MVTRVQNHPICPPLVTMPVTEGTTANLDKI
jgi:hypothetical protein